MRNFSKNIILWIVIGLLLVALFNLFKGTTSNRTASLISFSDFISAIDAGNVSEVIIRGNNVEGYFNDGRSFKTFSPNYPNLVDKLAGNLIITTSPRTGDELEGVLNFFSKKNLQQIFSFWAYNYRIHLKFEELLF